MPTITRYVITTSLAIETVTGEVKSAQEYFRSEANSVKIWNKGGLVNHSYLEASRKAGDGGKGMVSTMDNVIDVCRDTYIVYTD